MKRTVLIAGLAVLALACGDRPGPTDLVEPVVAADPPATAGLDSHQRVELNRFFFSACTGEFLLLQGQLHTFTDVDSDGAGGFHVKRHLDLHMTGTSASGRRYVLNEQRTRTVNARPPFPFTETLVWNFRLLAQGPGDDLVVKQREHLTVDANGEVRSEFEEFESECT